MISELPDSSVMAKLHGFSGSFLKLLLHVVWPANCPLCGALGEMVCRDCLASLIQQVPPFCLECGRTAPCGIHGDAPLCRAGSYYSGINRKLVHTMKYSGGRGLALSMGRLLAEHFSPPEADFLVPVPLHTDSERDYNQAELIANGASEVWGIPVSGALRWRTVIPRQANKPGGERALGDDAIDLIVMPPAGSTVFLTDDIYTTGSTLRSASAALSKRGFKVAGAMVWSRGKG